MIRWGIIGCGAVCEVKSGPAFAKCRDGALDVIMSRRAEHARDYARRHGVPRWTTDARAVARDPAVDAVYVASPPGSHLEHALLVAEAGKPCYVEKPMARSYAECERMLDAFARAKVPLYVAYYRRALPRFVRVKELLEAQRLGKVTSIEIVYTAPKAADLQRDAPPWRLLAEHAGGGLFFDLACHTLDLIDFWFGPALEVRGRAANRATEAEVEDVVVMELAVEGGPIGTALFDYAAARSEDRITIRGADGVLSVPTFGDTPLRVETRRGVELIEIANPEHIQQPLIQSVIDELQGRGRCPSTGESAARTAQRMDAVTESYYGSRAGDFWSRPERWPGARRAERAGAVPPTQPATVR